jgi:hypothetical protein
LLPAVTVEDVLVVCCAKLLRGVAMTQTASAAMMDKERKRFISCSSRGKS